MTYDYMAGEWFGKCGACDTPLFAPNKSAYILQYSIHTHSDKCLGGW